MALAFAVIVVHDRDLHHRHGAGGRGPGRPDRPPGRQRSCSSPARRSSRSTTARARRIDRSRSSLALTVRRSTTSARSSSALLIGVFIYWGWESAVNLTEETTDSARAPGLAAVVQHVILLVTYVGVRWPSSPTPASRARRVTTTTSDLRRARGGRARLAVGQARDPRDRDLGYRLDADDDHPLLANVVLDGPRRTPAARVRGRSTRASARRGSRRSSWPRGSRSPGTCRSNLFSENFLFDTLSALSLMIAFYYALTGLACAVFYRRELLRVRRRTSSSSASAPLVGAVILGYLFAKSAIDLSDPANSYTGQTFSAWAHRS